ncbi:hypothetical protein IAD21_02818 [Abditibacteriota bacterium]|nr:hypothetical protein IAD21_02818 [Abditibacteriota bacterium]
MKAILLFGILAIVPMVARANDSSFEGVGGSMRPTRGENTAIRMVRETVVLTTNADDYSTRADFVFSNETGRAQNVSMGFPEGNFGDVSSDGPMKTSGFRGFKTLVDGRPFVAKRTILREMDSSGFDTYWIKTVAFAPHQTRHVRVEFRSPYGGSNDWGMTNSLSYSFTGANWRGNVGESVLEVRVTQPGLWRAVGFGSNRKILPFALSSDKNSATFRRVWKNWNAQDDVTFGLERSTPFWRKDTTGYDSGGFTMKTVLATQTVRVGPKPKELDDSQGVPTEGFTYNNTFYVGVNYLTSKLDMWGDEHTPKFESKLTFAQATGFDLRAGKLRIQGREGDSVLRINGKAIATGTPVITTRSYGTRMLYVPFAPLGRELGWKLTLKGERMFSLERGNWQG